MWVEHPHERKLTRGSAAPSRSSLAGRPPTRGCSSSASSRAVGRSAGSFSRQAMIACESGSGTRRGQARGSSTSCGKRSSSEASSSRVRGLLEREPARHRVVERRAEPPDVGRRADVAVGVALLGGHVGVRADVVAEALGTLERACQAQVDHPRRNPHHQVVRLEIEVDPAVGGHVVDRGGNVQAERQRLLERQRTAALDQPAQRRPLEVLDKEVRVGPVHVDAEPAQQDRVSQCFERVRLAAQAAQGVLVLDRIRAHRPSPPSPRRASRPRPGKPRSDCPRRSA